MKKVLTLNLETKYFDQIKSGKKLWEYREHKTYWDKRIINKKFDYIKICKGYPSDDDKTRIIWRKYNGYISGYFDNEKFGNNVLLLAIDVSKLIYKNQHLAPSLL